MFGEVGSSINFTCNFSNGVETETWGLKDSVSATVDVNKKLISIGLQGQLPMTPPQAYVGRVGGSGNASSGFVIFILTKIKKAMRHFMAASYFLSVYILYPLKAVIVLANLLLSSLLFNNKNNTNIGQP